MHLVWAKFAQTRLAWDKMEKTFYFFNKIALANGGPGAGGRPGSFTLENPLGSNTIMGVINNVLNYLMLISVPILAIMILIGGFQILTAAGNPTKITSGRHTITYAVIGFAIILISKGVALVILNILG